MSEPLCWINPEDGATFNAGVAFYQEKYGEYKLILNAPKTVLYLKAVEASEEKIRYQVTAPVFRRGQYSHREVVGYGYSNPETDGHIYMIIGRYYPNRLTFAPRLGAEETEEVEQ